MTPKKSAGGRHHTIPRLYLRRFLEPGLVYRHGQLEPRRHHKCTNVSVRVNYYGRPGTKLPFVDPINSFVERNCAPSLEKLINKHGEINSNDWIMLSYLFANIWLRNPDTIEDIKRTYLQLRKAANEMSAKMIEAAKKNKDAIRQLADNKLPSDRSGTFTLEELNKEARILEGKHGHLFAASGLYPQTKNIAQCIQNMTFLLLKAPHNNHFVSCDRPLSLISGSTGSPVGAGWGNRDVLGNIPLSPKVLLIMLYYENKVIVEHMANAQEVIESNSYTIGFANMEVYGVKTNSEAYSWMRRRRR